jgi:hypothetical protein
MVSAPPCTTVQLRILLFWVVAPHTLVVCYQRFWITDWSHTDMNPEMLVINYNVVKFLKIYINKIMWQILIKFCIENLHQQNKQYQKSITHGMCTLLLSSDLMFNKNFKKSRGDASTQAITKVISKLPSRSRTDTNIKTPHVKSVHCIHCSTKSPP